MDLVWMQARRVLIAREGSSQVRGEKRWIPAVICYMFKAAEDPMCKGGERSRCKAFVFTLTVHPGWLYVSVFDQTPGPCPGSNVSPRSCPELQ